VRRQISILAVAVVFGCSTKHSDRGAAAMSADRQADRPGPAASAFGEYLAHPPAESDPARALLVLAERVRRDESCERIDIESYVARIDAMAGEAAGEAGGRRGAEAVGAFNRFFFERMEAGASPEAGYAAGLFPDSVLRTGKGDCLALAGLYLAISSRLDLAVHGVVVPGHFFVRYDDGQTRINVEMLRGGLARDDAFYRERFGVPEGDACYMRNLLLDETLAVFVFNVANRYAAAGRTDLAERALARVVEILPGFAEAHGNLGVLLYRRGEASLAVACFERAVETNRLAGGAWLNLGVARQALGRLDEAAGAYRSGIAVTPESAELRHGLGTALHRLGRLDEAVAEYVEALKLRPDFARAHGDLAAAYLVQGKSDLALRHLDLAGRSEAAEPTPSGER